MFLASQHRKSSTPRSSPIARNTREVSRHLTMPRPATSSLSLLASCQPEPAAPPATPAAPEQNDLPPRLDRPKLAQDPAHKPHLGDQPVDPTPTQDAGLPERTGDLEV